MAGKPWKKTAIAALLLLVLALLASCLPAAAPTESGGNQTPPAQTLEPQVKLTSAPTSIEAIPENSILTSKEEVSLYLHTYGRLPDNFTTKAEARALGWSGGDLRPFAKDTCIGGDRFGNYEGLLPQKRGRVYYECDVDTLGRASRGAKRIVYSNDGLIYYTDDHYKSFILLYSEDGHAGN